MKAIQMVNKFEGYCECGGFVAEGRGYIVRTESGPTKFQVHHQDADCPLVHMAKNVTMENAGTFGRLLAEVGKYRHENPAGFTAVWKLIDEMGLQSAVEEWAVAEMGGLWWEFEKHSA